MCTRAKQKGVRKTGWLSKRGGRIHTWHRRWFVLTGDLLFYYKQPNDSRPTGTIPLAGNRVIRHEDKQPNSFKFEIVAGKEHQVITSNHDTYLISAESAEDANDWVAAIKRVMHEPYGGGMFGRSLEETMQVEARLGGTFIPVLIHRCVRFIRENGLNEIGIFRLPGQASRIHQLQDLYNQGSQLDFSPHEDLHTVASLLKLYLRELPEPLVPFVYYDSFRRAIQLYEANRNEGVDEIKRLLIQIPKANFNLLKYLSRFLHEVQEHSDTNKMNCVNLGTIFGPNFLRPRTNNPQVLMECNNVSTDFVTIIITIHEEFFPFTPDERPPKRLSIILPSDDIPIVWHESKLVSRSLYDSKPGKSKSGEAHRPRQNSAPTSTLEKQAKATLRHSHGEVIDRRKKLSDGSKVASMIEQFNMHTTRSASQLMHSMRFSDSAATSNGVADHRISLPVQRLQNGGLLHLQHNGLSRSITDDDDDVPEVLKRLSDASQGRSDTLQSDVIVNSITIELESLEKQLLVAKEEALKYKKAARLWKSRYEQERRARLAAEDQIHTLQAVIDETFQQFALDDSEDDFCEVDSGDASSISCDSPRLANGKKGGLGPVLLPALQSDI